MQLSCPWEASQYVFFSTDPGVPQLLYYAYIPIIFIALVFGLFVFVKDKKSLRSFLLLLIAIFFVGLTLNNIFEWVSNNAAAQMFSWQIAAALEFPISLLSIYFMYVFFEGKDLDRKLKYIMGLVFLLVIVLLPTAFNVQEFYLTDEDCGGVLGPLWMFIYSFEILSVLIVAYMGVNKYFRIKKDKTQALQTLFFTIGSIIFLGLFSFSNIFGELTKTYQINLIGPIGLLLFICLLAYSIVKYNTFNIKLVGAQALVISLMVLISSQFFFIQNNTNRILTAITLVITGAIGLNLIRSVKKEIKQREQVEELAGQLADTNKRQEGLLHFIGHEVKGFLTKDMGAFAALAEGDVGTLDEPSKTFVAQALAQTREGVQSVTELLQASNQKKGTMTYKMELFDLKGLVEETVAHLRPIAEQKGLLLILTVDETLAYTISGDKSQLGDHVLRNLIDNAINYTPSGSVRVSLKKEGNKSVFTVQDTGIGISSEDKKILFTEGGKGKDSQKVNVHSTGYGLYIAKGIVTAHKGTIRAESDGPGKGSRFVVELPA